MYRRDGSAPFGGGTGADAAGKRAAAACEYSPHLCQSYGKDKGECADYLRRLYSGDGGSGAAGDPYGLLGESDLFGIRERYPEDYEARGKNFADFKPEGGETFRECRRRAYLAYRRILTEADGNIAIVAHAGLNRALISLLEDRSLSEVMEIPQAYGSVYHWNIGPRLGAVITAAGCSSRMGSLKPLLPLGGESLLERECRTLFRGRRQADHDCDRTGKRSASRSSWPVRESLSCIMRSIRRPV